MLGLSVERQQTCAAIILCSVLCAPSLAQPLSSETDGRGFFVEAQGQSQSERAVTAYISLKFPARTMRGNVCAPSYSLIANVSGEVRYIGHSCVCVGGMHKMQIDPDKVKEWLDVLQTNSFWHLPALVTNPMARDQGEVQITAALNGKEHSVSASFPDSNLPRPIGRVIVDFLKATDIYNRWPYQKGTESCP